MLGGFAIVQNTAARPIKSLPNKQTQPAEIKLCTKVLISGEFKPARNVTNMTCMLLSQPILLDVERFLFLDNSFIAGHMYNFMCYRA